MTSGYTVFGHSAPPLPMFRPAFPWLGGDLQTIKNTLSWTSPDFLPHRQTRLRFPMSDGSGDILQGILDQPEPNTKQPLLILVHGLTGCEESRNIMTSAFHYLSEGFPVLRLNLRGAGPSLGTCNQHYHAGRTEDLADVVNGIPETLSENGIVLVGASLGGNAVLKYVGEGSAPPIVKAAASVCAPIDLKAAQMRIMTARNRIYHRYLINRMKADALNGASEQVRHDMASRLEQVETVYDFDDRIVAVDNGFGDAETYYRQCSAGQFIDAIRIPTLIIHAATDPWIPLAMYMDRRWPDTAPVTLAVCRDGGHVGFHSQLMETPWHNACVSTFLKKEMGGP